MTSDHHDGTSGQDHDWNRLKAAWGAIPPPEDLPEDLPERPPERAPDLASDAVAHRSRAFDDMVRRRNLVEYAAFVGVALFFGAVALGLFGHPSDATVDVVLRVGAFATAFGAVLAAWQLYRRASVPSPDPGMDCLSFFLTHLRRQRNALRSVGAWYLGPLLPGIGLMLTSGFLGPWPAPMVSALAFAVVAIIFSGILVVNHRAASALQDQIQSLEGEAAKDGEPG